MIGGTQTGGPSLGGKGQGGHGMKKSEGFFKLRVSHTCSGNYSVCDGRCTQHSVSHAHCRCTFSLRDVQTSRSRKAQGVCSVNVICLHLALCSHVSSAVLVVPAWSLRHHIPVRTVFVELYPTQKRGSSALPHERRGVWLPDRSRTPQGVRQDHFCRR